MTHQIDPDSRPDNRQPEHTAARADDPADDWIIEDDPAAAPPCDSPKGAPWRVLIVDDEPSVHEVTELVMEGFEFENRPLAFRHAYSGVEAKQVLAQEPDFSLIVLDVVMETDDAGLHVASYLRRDLKNAFPRIILRTGQPGHAPEEHVIRDYDINDYKEKSELTERKLKTMFISAFRGYRDLMRIESARQNLCRTIDAIATIRDSQNLFSFASLLMTQLKHVLGVETDHASPSQLSAHVAARNDRNSEMTVIALTDGLFSRSNSMGAPTHLPDSIRSEINHAFASRQTMMREDRYIGYFSCGGSAEGVLHIVFDPKHDSIAQEYLTIFAENVIMTYEYLLAREEIESGQHTSIMLICEAVEKRSKETGVHVLRVGEISAILASDFDISTRDVEFIRQAAPLHDLGKIGIPDAILNKPGKLDPHEWEIMKTHSAIGQDMLKKSDSPMLRLGASIAGEHHECWDGSGYPLGLKGEEISLAGRVVAVADVLDALLSHRCYKSPWIFEDAEAYILSCKGTRFDPQVIDAFVRNRDAILEVYLEYPEG
ncbi:DUF3369 domain-containing protein [Burkholderiaceae bacterium DAT-1]|nr:DUF3369 domain-containing protein [Burkholderiaceae bacterium DAT-1]